MGGCSRLLLAAPGCSWLLLAVLLAAPGCSWPWRCSWLLLAVPGCSWLLLAPPGCPGKLPKNSSKLWETSRTLWEAPEASRELPEALASFHGTPGPRKLCEASKELLELRSLQR